MAYFVVERSGDEGVLGIPLPQAYETREAAIAALSAATASGEVVLAGEVFIADLGSAVPVLIMQSAAPVAPIPVAADEPEYEPEVIADEPVAEAEDARVLDEAGADEAYTSWEPLGEVASEGGSLADALKRAATSLEDEGIIAPESVESAAESEETAGDTDEAESGDVDEDFALLAEAGVGEPPLEAEDTGETGDAESWPWANVESYEIKAGTLEAEDAVESVVAEEVAEPASITFDEDAGSELEEIDVETSPIITSAPPEGEDAYMPHPVILGDYAENEPAGEIEVPEESEEPPASTEPEESLAPEESEDSDESEPVTTLEEPDEPAVAAAEDEGEAEAPTAPPSLDDILGAMAPADSAPVAFDAGYEPAGDLDLAGYTCSDCVYSNTCPKVGQTTPAECGSFQWKSE